MNLLLKEYQNKDEKYYQNLKYEIINYLIKIQKKKLRVLEIGCGAGFTSKLLKEIDIAGETYGIELVQEQFKIAKRNLDYAIQGDVEEIELTFDVNYFDLIIAGDVLEHLKNPWRQIKKLKTYLKQDGFFLATIPNIRNFKIIFNLFFRGKWTYKSKGILDITHLRFFTKREMRKMFLNDFEFVKIIPTFKLLNKPYNSKIKRAKIAVILNFLSLTLGEEFLANQYLISATNKI